METKEKNIIKGKSNTLIDDKKRKKIKHRTTNKITIK